MLDANGTVNRGPVKQAFDELLMRETMTTHHRDGELPTETYVRGSTIIDGIFATSDIPVSFASWLAHNSSPGDHCALVVNIPWLTLLGKDVLKIVRPDARRLTCSNKKAKLKYVEELDKQLTYHKVLPRLHQLEAQHLPGRPLTTEQATEAEVIDRVKTDAMRSAEKQCRKLKMGDVDFSPEVNLTGTNVILWLVYQCIWVQPNLL